MSVIIRKFTHLPSISFSNYLSKGITQNKRCFASQNNADDARTGAQGFKLKKGGVQKKKVVKENTLGAFRPMPVSELGHPLFGVDLPDPPKLTLFHPEALTSRAIGKAMEFSLPDSHAFRKFGLPKNALLEYRILWKPCSVVRESTIAAINIVEAASKKSSLETRIVFTGRRGCGKSFLLMQTVEYCASKGWIIIYIPRAVRLVNSTTNYMYDSRTRTYLQPTFCYQTLQRFLTVNAHALDSLQTQRELVLENDRVIAPNTPLGELVDIGLKEQALAPTILSLLLEELGAQQQYPVLLAIDDFQALYSTTLYKDPHFASIKSYHLSVPRLLMEYSSGKKSFTRGAVLGAINASDTHFPIPPELRAVLDHERPDVHTKISPTLVEYTKGLQSFAVPEKLSVREAASLFEVWTKGTAMHDDVYDELFLSKYSESSGNARDFVWKGLLSTLDR